MSRSGSREAGHDPQRLVDARYLDDADRSDALLRLPVRHFLRKLPRPIRPGKLVCFFYALIVSVIEAGAFLIISAVKILTLILP